MDVLSIASVAGPTALVTAGAAWASVKVKLNGTAERVKQLEAAHVAHTDRLARIETKIDLLLEKK